MAKGGGRIVSVGKGSSFSHGGRGVARGGGKSGRSTRGAVTADFGGSGGVIRVKPSTTIVLGTVENYGETYKVVMKGFGNVGDPSNPGGNVDALIGPCFEITPGSGFCFSTTHILCWNPGHPPMNEIDRFAIPGLRDKLAELGPAQEWEFTLGPNGDSGMSYKLCPVDAPEAFLFTGDWYPGSLVNSVSLPITVTIGRLTEQPRELLARMGVDVVNVVGVTETASDLIPAP